MAPKQMMIHNTMGYLRTIEDFGFTNVPICKEVNSKGNVCNKTSTRLCLNVFTGEVTHSCGYHLKKIQIVGQTYEVFSKVTKYVGYTPYNYFKVTSAYFGPITYVQWLNIQITDSKAQDEIQTLRNMIEYMNTNAIEEGKHYNVINQDGTYTGTLQYINLYLDYLASKTPQTQQLVDVKCEWETYQTYILESVKRFNKIKHDLDVCEKKQQKYIIEYKKLDKCKLGFTRTDECSICLSNVESHAKGGTLRNCGHIFHNECLSNWLISNNSCPNCRCKIHLPMFML
jgi:hypothetical protein